jgi:haloalkane dehalogenase
MRPRELTVSAAACNYWESGSGEAILYLHGFPTSGYLWRHVLGETAQSFRAIAPDFPGFGRSELMGGPHTWRALIDWLDQFVTELEIAPVHLGVHDWGGLIGIAWACEHPDKVSSLLITDTSFRSTDRWHGLATEWRKPVVGEQMLGSITREGLQALLSAASQHIPEDAIDEYWSGLNTEERISAKLEMYRSLDFEMLAPLEPRLDQIAPGRTRVVWGANDPFVPQKVAHWFGERLGTEVNVLENASHFLQEDAGQEIGRIHREFLESLS